MKFIEWVLIGIIIFLVFIFLWNSFSNHESFENIMDSGDEPKKEEDEKDEPKEEDEKDEPKEEDEEEDEEEKKDKVPTDSDSSKMKDSSKDYEYYKIVQDANHELGNFLSCYFYNLGLSFLHGKNYKTKITKNKDMFTNYFPEKVELDKSVQQELISVGITDKILEKELGKIDKLCRSSWYIFSKNLENFWTILKPTINRILKEALEKSKLKKSVDGPVIHYRCSDSPMNKLGYYHFQKYGFFKDGLDMIQQKTGNTYDKVYICYCNSHGAPKANQESCDKYVKSLTDYLESLGYTVITKCQSVNEDFATMFYAPGLISTSSSFSFFAGYFSDGVFITSIYDEPNDRVCEECGDWSNSGYTLKPSEVDDYHDTDTVINKLKK
jgi:hypothetical protein